MFFCTFLIFRTTELDKILIRLEFTAVPVIPNSIAESKNYIRTEKAKTVRLSQFGSVSECVLLDLSGGDAPDGTEMQYYRKLQSVVSILIAFNSNSYCVVLF